MNGTPSRSSQWRHELSQLIFLALALGAALQILLLSPAFWSPLLLSIVFTTVLSPAVSFLERRGFSRIGSILLIFSFGILGLLLGSFLGIHGIITQWHSFEERAPILFYGMAHKLRGLEAYLKGLYPILQDTTPTDSFLQWGKDTGKWFEEHGTALMGELLTWTLLTPVFSFFLLSEGPILRKYFLMLVPNRFFESFYLVMHSMIEALTGYIRVKLLEALLMGLMVTAGLTLAKAPYAIVLGIIAGVTNVIPYLGPFLGAIPGVLITVSETASEGHPSELLIPVFLVYLIANSIDMLLIFPVIVARLINLHPLVLIAVVTIGQKYYGMIGMLISVPLATSLKVILQELYVLIYRSAPIPFSFTSNSGTFHSDNASSERLDPSEQEKPTRN